MARPFIAARRRSDWLKRGAAQRIHLEHLPSYAPDLNPEAGIWNDLKRVELSNVCCQNLVHLQTEVIRGRERLRHKRSMIQAWLHACVYT